MRQPRLAEMVADSLRAEIVSGRIPDGGSLPKQDDLLERFEVSRPSLREAIQILETEGLLTVHRGRTGGATVHRPTVEGVAYILGIVLQGGQVTLGDVAHANDRIIPLCAKLCAAREDRAEEVLPALRPIQERSTENVRDELAFAQEMEDFHRVLVARCGNGAMSAMIGALELLYASNFQMSAERAVERHTFPDIDARRLSLGAHEAIIDAIEEGDAERAELLTREHISRDRATRLSHQVVDAKRVRLVTAE